VSLFNYSAKHLIVICIGELLLHVSVALTDKCVIVGRKGAFAFGKHAKLLNRLVVKMNDRLDEEDRIEAAKLRERLGHKRREVLAGIVFGTLVAFAVCSVWDFWKEPPFS
jgi:acid phosphatase family membrane protein YuiD